MEFSDITKDLLDKVGWFREYFNERWHKESSLLIINYLGMYIKRKVLDENYDILWDNDELNNIMKIVSEAYNKGNDYIKSSVTSRLLNQLFTFDREKFNKLRKIVKYKELQEILDIKYESWNVNIKANKEQPYITLEKLKQIEKEEMEKINDNNLGSGELLLNEVVKLLNYDLSFREFMEKGKHTDVYWLPYFTFGYINRYIKDCYEKKEYDKINYILEYLDKVALSEDEEVSTLLVLWFLENLDNQKDLLPDLVPMMPKNLKKLFLDSFSYYLD